MKRDNLDFLDAMEKLSGPNETPTITAPIKPIADPGKWGDAARLFMEDSVVCLWSAEGNAALQYLHNRGLNDDTLRYWAIGFNALEGYGNPREWGVVEKVFLPRGIVIPCWKSSLADITYLKIRRSAGEPRYTNIKGGKQWLFGGFTFVDGAGMGSCLKRELDVLLGMANGVEAALCFRPSGQHLQPEYYQYFNHIDCLIVAMTTTTGAKCSG